MRPKTYLFPGTVNGSRADKPITSKVPWEACQEAAKRAGITKRVSPHLIRHSFATHLMENGADLPTVQALLGHTHLKPTSIYLHLSERHLKAAGTPLDKAVLSTAGSSEAFAPASQKTGGAKMSRPPLEVADIIRAIGKRFIDRNRCWLTGLHLTAIERL
jgi:Phage integrase family